MSSPAVLVTGGAARIGAAISRAFAAAGWHVVIHYRDSSDEAEALAATLPSAETVRCDLSDMDPRFPRYPVLPVIACAGHMEGEPHGSSADTSRQ